MKISPRTLGLVTLTIIAVAALVPLALRAADEKKPVGYPAIKIRATFKKGAGNENVILGKPDNFREALFKHAKDWEDLSFNGEKMAPKSKDVRTESVTKASPSSTGSPGFAGVHVAQHVTFESTTAFESFIDDVEPVEPTPTPTATPTARPTATPSETPGSNRK